MITPQKFAQLVYECTLDEADKKSLINLLYHLSIEQIENVTRILEEDVKSQKDIFSQAEDKKAKILLKLDVDLANLELKTN